jgi:UDP-N-acetylmuramoylalanine--D-glutamate ligase
MRLLVYGMGVAGEAVARAAHARGIHVTATDDRWTKESLRSAEILGIDVEDTPSSERLNELVGSADVIMPSPGVPDHHPLIGLAVAAGVPLRTEIDLAYEWEQDRAAGPRPMLAITGTDGKTTVTTLVTAMVDASGRRAVACGNTDTPLVAALDLDVDVFVVECASFRLRWLTCFRPEVGTWLNLAPDHLDWHRTLDAYAAAKARMWEYQHSSDVAVAFADDAQVMDRARQASGRLVTFGTAAHYRESSGVLEGPAGPIVAVTGMWRALPHDRTNALAAAATALEAGAADLDGVRRALLAFRGIPHRIAFVAEDDGVAFYDDSKATTPHAALTAIRGFGSVVLIAGGRNKDLDLSSLAAEPARMRAVIAIGESAAEVGAAFAGVCLVNVADSMDEAVARARALAQRGDTVLLSPACTSFDWYGDYAERGDDFARAVRLALKRETCA